MALRRQFGSSPGRRYSAAGTPNGADSPGKRGGFNERDGASEHYGEDDNDDAGYKYGSCRGGAVDYTLMGKVRKSGLLENGCRERMPSSDGGGAAFI